MHVATGFVKPGTFVRRHKDGMIGRAERVNSMSYSRGISYDQNIMWLGEWTYGTWVPGRRGVAVIEVLDGADADEARARFERLMCPACGGTGAKDRLHAPSDGNRCRAEHCILGRLLGVEPAFDASYAKYRHQTDAPNADKGSQTSPKTDGAVAEWHDAVLKYAGTCVECGASLGAGVAAQMRKADGRWAIRCAGHKTV